MSVNTAAVTPISQATVSLLLGSSVIALVVGCGGVTHAPHPRSAPRPDPTEACLQLQNFGLHNHGQGASPAFRQKLEAETKGTPLGVDVTQWAQDLAAPAATQANVEQVIRQDLSDAGAVSSDCLTYGVRNVLSSGS